MKITNVTVGKIGSEHAEWCLSWHLGEDRYHVWLKGGGDTFEVQPGVGTGGRGLYKTVADPERGPSASKVRYLDHTVEKNQRMIAQALGQAQHEGLFTKALANLLEAEEKRLAEAAAGFKVEQAKEQGPRMLVLLKAIAAFWQDGGNPLSPGALILDGDERTILEAVEAAIRLAEGAKF